jgi:NAD(P)-dependent dehydrogenase (short-subunit alcohol dehydrogenase family)
MATDDLLGGEVLDLRRSLAGKVALVTGGLGGIGRECIRSLFAHGASVAFSYADGHEPEALAREWVAQAPQRLSAHALDLQQVASITRCIAEAHARWGRLDILVNNAAVGSATVAAYAGEAHAQDSAMLAINADGTLKMCQHFLALAAPRLATQAVKLINIASVGGGVSVFPGFKLSDGMSKAAVAFMTRQLAAEHTGTQAQIFAVCPGATNTRMFQQSTLDGMTDQQRAEFFQRLPKQRLIEPAEIARIVSFLASDYSAALHGAVIDASMGLGVRPGLMSEMAGH